MVVSYKWAHPLNYCNNLLTTLSPTFWAAQIWLKQLSLRPIAPHIKAIEGTEPIHTISHTVTFKEAISHMATLHVSSLRVVNADGTVLGQVHATDLLETSDV